MVNILEVLGVVAVPVGQTVATALVGAALAHPRIGAVTIEGKATLCKVGTTTLPRGSGRAPSGW